MASVDMDTVVQAAMVLSAQAHTAFERRRRPSFAEETHVLEDMANFFADEKAFVVEFLEFLLTEEHEGQQYPLSIRVQSLKEIVDNATLFTEDPGKEWKSPPRLVVEHAKKRLAPLWARVQQTEELALHLSHHPQASTQHKVATAAMAETRGFPRFVEDFMTALRACAPQSAPMSTGNQQMIASVLNDFFKRKWSAIRNETLAGVECEQSFARRHAEFSNQVISYGKQVLAELDASSVAGRFEKIVQKHLSEWGAPAHSEEFSKKLNTRRANTWAFSAPPTNREQHLQALEMKQEQQTPASKPAKQ